MGPFNIRLIPGGISRLSFLIQVGIFLVLDVTGASGWGVFEFGFGGGCCLCFGRVFGVFLVWFGFATWPFYYVTSLWLLLKCFIRQSPCLGLDLASFCRLWFQRQLKLQRLCGICMVCVVCLKPLKFPSLLLVLPEGPEDLIPPCLSAGWGWGVLLGQGGSLGVNF